jgi:hypothetical protein
MVTGNLTLAQQLEAVGRVLEERAPSLKQVCVMQSGDDFIVHGLEAKLGRGQSNYLPVTIEIEADEVRAARLMIDGKRDQPWWRR